MNLINIHIAIFFVTIFTLCQCQNDEIANEQRLELHNEEAFEHKINYTWTIDNWSYRERIGETLFSPKFAAFSYIALKWHLAVVFRETNLLDVSLFVTSNNLPQIVHTRYSVSLLNKQDEIGYRLQTERTFETEPSRYKPGGNNYGWRNFITRNVDFRNTYVSNDAVRFFVELEFSVEDEHTPESTNGLSYQFNISASGNMALLVNLLLKNHGCADVILEAGGHKYPAHRIILIASSPVFRDILINVKPTKPDAPIHIDLGNFSIQVMREVLRYIYLGTSKPTLEIADELLEIASKFKWVNLVNDIIQTMLSSSVRVEDAPIIYQIASKYELPDVKENVIKVMLDTSVQNPDLLCDLYFKISSRCN